MGRLIVTEFLTIDGVMEAPGSEEHRSGRNQWALRGTDEEMQEFNSRQPFDAEVLLLGRVTYQIWAAFWPSMADEPTFGRRVNEMPKYVVSQSLAKADWTNTTILRGDVAEEVRALKDRVGGDVFVYGSADLVHELLRHDLVDELRLMVFPVVLGSGKRLFRDEAALRHFRLASTRPFPSGAVLSVYEPATEAPDSPYAAEYAWTQEQVESLHAAQDTNRVLATVMFTDIVESTARAAALGDRGWRKLLDRHDEIARTEVERWHGQLVKSTGDGVLATFDAPTRALRCAFAIQRALAGQGLEIRVAIHCGEVELRGDDIGGIGIHIASRALAEAGDGQVLVTRTVRELATGTDLVFTSRGNVSLRGVPGHWELYEASIG
ncbi:MAG TPA: dihydrofolate reductase family protein [Candidatus Limnocylindrales bacterium]|jgi:class 3 adenylate cyclase